jgi:hypothetical protein
MSQSASNQEIIAIVALNPLNLSIEKIDALTVKIATVGTVDLRYYLHLTWGHGN